MNKIKILILLTLLLSFNACKTAKEMCLDTHNCYHKTNKEKTKYCNYFKSSSRVASYKKYLKKTDDIKDQLIVIENGDWFQGKYFGKNYIFFKDGVFDKMIRADVGNFFTRKIRDKTDEFLDYTTNEEIDFYIEALEYLESLNLNDENCSIEITQETLTKVSEHLSLKIEADVSFGGLSGNSTINVFDKNLRLIKQYYSSRQNLKIYITEKLDFDFKKK